MRRKTMAVLGAPLLALALGAAAGTAETAPPPGEHGPWMGRAGHMARVLGLSEQQQEGVRKVMQERRADHQALREKLEANREAMGQALEGASPDPTAVGELAIEAHRMRQQERALRDAQDKAIRELLTPEQKAKFDAMKAMREEGMGGRHGDGFGPRPERGGHDHP